jgi:hypothetical protein
MRGFDLFTASKRRSKVEHSHVVGVDHMAENGSEAVPPTIRCSERRRSPRIEPEEDSVAAEAHSERTPPIGLFQQPAGA